MTIDASPGRSLGDESLPGITVMSLPLVSSLSSSSPSPCGLSPEKSSSDSSGRKRLRVDDGEGVEQNGKGGDWA